VQSAAKKVKSGQFRRVVRPTELAILWAPKSPDFTLPSACRPPGILAALLFPT
jgi:hypothetical protein